MKEWLDVEIDKRRKKLEAQRIEVVERMYQIRITDDEVITRIQQINGLAVEITKKTEVKNL